MKNKITRQGITCTLTASGKWHTKIRVGDKSKSITCATWNECVEQALSIKAQQERYLTGTQLLGEALDQYIAIREPVVSPATIRTYNSYIRNWLQELSTIPIHKIDRRLLQTLINEMVSKGKSTKYMKSVIAFVTAVYNEYTEQNKAFKVIYPQSIKKVHYLPTEDDLSILMAYTKANDVEVYKALCIALTTNLRIGQVCALRGRDLDRKNNLISSFTSMVRAEDTWIEKAPKTDVSARMILVPPVLFDILDNNIEADERIVKSTPHTLGERFVKCVHRAGLHHFVFHDLRHFNASLYHKMSIPAQYAIELGGWANVTVMNNVYTQTFADEKLKYSNEIISTYNKLLI